MQSSFPQNGILTTMEYLRPTNATRALASKLLVDLLSYVDIKFFFFRNTTEYGVNRLIKNVKNKSFPTSTYPVKVLKYISEIMSPF